MSEIDPAAAELIRGRRTINEFRADAPTRQVVLEAIELARWAPNHKLTEPWRFLLVGPETKAAIVDLNARLVATSKGADAGEKKRERWAAVPGWLVVTTAVGIGDLRDREDYAACCCAIQNLSLALWSAGVGVKWTTGDVTRHPEFLELLGIDPSRRSVVGLLWYGYPEKVPAMKRTPVEEIVEERL